MPTDVAGMAANCEIGRIFQVAGANGLLITAASALESVAANCASERLLNRSDTRDKKEVAALPSTNSLILRGLGQYAEKDASLRLCLQACHARRHPLVHW